MKRALSACAIVVALSVATLTIAAESQPDPPLMDPLLSLIPQDGEIEGWVRDGTAVLCYDEESLSEYIDGAAPYYLERGTVAVLFQYYLHPATRGEIKIEIYGMREGDSARRLFQEIERGKPASGDQDSRELGEGRHLEQALRGVWILEFYQGPFFVRVEGRGEGKQARGAVLAFGLRLSHSIGQLGSKIR